MGVCAGRSFSSKKRGNPVPQKRARRCFLRSLQVHAPIGRGSMENFFRDYKQVTYYMYVLKDVTVNICGFSSEIFVVKNLRLSNK
jgi:hypothetical protein